MAAPFGTLQAASDTRVGYTVGIYTRPWDRFDYRVALDAIAEAGFKHAGLMTTKTEGRRLVIDESTTVEEAAKIGEEVEEPRAVDSVGLRRRNSRSEIARGRESPACGV
jgi:hypothetical protein